MGTASYPQHTLTEAWKRFIFHQFHDDLTGTSIPRAYEFSWNDELISLKQFSQVLTSSVNAIAGQMDTRVKGTPVVLYNANAFPVSDLTEIILEQPKAPKGFTVYNAQGKKVASQMIGYENGRAHILVAASLPANSYAVYDVRTGGSEKTISPSAASAIENSVYKITLDKNGDIISLTDKRNNKELVKDGKAIRLALFTENKSYAWPAWEILKETIDREPVSITDGAKITLVENGALRKALCIEKKYGKSLFKQYIRLYEGSRADRIDFYNEIDWQSTNTLLKAEFPLNVSNEKATYDLGIGSIQRGNNVPTAYEVYAHYWADLTDKNESYGVSILNDSKYGWDKPNDNTIRLTLLHTPETKRNYAYQNRQDFGFHSFTYSLIGHDGKLDKAETVQQGELLNQRLKAFQTDSHKGTLGKTFSFASSDNRNVLLKALKKAESSDEYVVRVYETEGKQEQKATLTFAGEITAACEADGTEKKIGNASFAGNTLQVSLKPYSVKTFKIKLKPSGSVAATLDSEYLALNYNRKCASWNEFRNEGNFESGYSYAAELLPESLTVNQIPFKLGEKDAANGMTCNGDTLQIPVGKGYNRIYFLAAATDADYEATFTTGKTQQKAFVPCYTGFIGQWGHTNHTEGYLKEAEIAYVGTHRHGATEDLPYEFTYMFKIGVDIPKGATTVILPANEKIVLFAATAVKETMEPVEVATQLFRTAVKGSVTIKEATVPKENILKEAHVMGWSGYTREGEHPRLMVDGNSETKWCDTSILPNYVDFDLGENKTISGWKLLNAGQESQSWITSDCFLQVKNAVNEEWKTVDGIFGNSSNEVSRNLSQPIEARYVRLLVTRPTQSKNGNAVRIYEFNVY